MSGRSVLRGRILCLALAGSLVLGGPAAALDDVSFQFPGADKKLSRDLLAASLVRQADRDGTNDPQDLFAAARADYGRLLAALYAQGYYGGTVSILIDGREAADIDLTDAPDRVGRIAVTVDPGPRFTFGAARMKPYAPGTRLPPAYRDGQIGYSTAIRDASRAGVEGWRALGYAKAAVAGQEITADHATRRVDAQILLTAGPQLSFGRLNLTGNDHLSDRRVAKIAGYRQGLRFDPGTLDKMVTRLRRTGIFRSVVLREADQPNADGTLDINLTVEEEAPRRFGFGAEISSADGADLSAFWLHRNLFGGGERFRADGRVMGIDGKSGLAEYELGARIERPGTPFTDSSVFSELRFRRQEILNLDVRSLSFGIGATRVMSDVLTAEAGISYQSSSISDPTFSDHFRVLALPVKLTWDRRDDVLDPTKGSYLTFGGTPFFGFGTTASGTQLKAEARLYRSFGTDDRLVFAGRAQAGTTVGTSLLTTPPDYLFYSGGGGTVRGHPFQSLGVTTRRGATTVAAGGLSFLALSGELRGVINDRLGAVAFVDAGYVGAQDWFQGSGGWQSGAGFGVRYDTGFGPVRLDIAFPVSGSTGNGMQVYVGIGQAF